MRHSKKYKEVISSLRWKRLKWVVIQERGRKCEVCNAIRMLDLHHLHYKTLGKETPEDVVLLCKKCHREIHRRHKRNNNG